VVLPSLRVRLVVQSVALAAISLWPALRAPNTVAVGSGESDTIKHLWTLWWMEHQLRAGDGMHTTLVNFPEGMTLFPIEPLNGLLALAIPGGAVFTSNVLAALHLVLTGLAAGWLGKLVSGTERGALAAAALLQGSAFMAFTLHVGVGELRQVWWLPLGLGVLWQAHHSRRPAWFLALAGVLAACVLSCFYHGLFLAVSVATWALCTLRWSGRLWLGYALAAVLSVAVVVPVVGSFAGTFGSGSPQDVVGPRGEVLLDYRAEAAHLDDLVRWKAPDPEPEARQIRAYAGGRYLGLLGLALAVAGLVASPRRALPWVAVGGVGTVLALGSLLWWGDERVLVGGHAIQLPLARLNQLLVEHAEPINFPARFLGVTAVALAVLGALAMRWPWLGLLVPAALADVAMHDLAVWPRATLVLPDMAGLDDSTLREAGVVGPIADLALAAESNEETRTLAVAAQLAGGFPTQGVPLERLDSWAPEGTAWLRARPVAALGNLARPGVRAPTDAELSADLDALRGRGFGGVMLTHRDARPDPTTDARLTAACGAPVRAAHATVWSLSER